MPQTKFMFVYSFSRRRHGDVTSASFIDKNDGGLSLKTPFIRRSVWWTCPPLGSTAQPHTADLVGGVYSPGFHPGVQARGMLKIYSQIVNNK
jgi:hypothetical protein